MVEKVKPAVKHVADIVGEWGRWQFNFTSFCFILWAAAALNNMGYSFHAYNNDFWCSDVPEDYQVLQAIHHLRQVLKRKVSFRTKANQ